MKKVEIYYCLQEIEGNMIKVYKWYTLRKQDHTVSIYTMNALQNAFEIGLYGDWALSHAIDAALTAEFQRLKNGVIL